MVDGMNNNFLNRVSFFRQSKKGSVTIEFALTLMILVIVFAFLADLVVQRSTQAKLDNTSLSLVSILRERVQLYNDNGNATLTDGTTGAAGGFSVVGSSDGDLNQYIQLANLMLFGDRNANKVKVTLERFFPDSKQYDKVSNSSACEPYKLLNTLEHLSPRSETNNLRKIPLYQVTLCVEVNSFFQSMIAQKGTVSNGFLRSSTFAPARAK